MSMDIPKGRATGAASAFNYPMTDEIHHCYITCRDRHEADVVDCDRDLLVWKERTAEISDLYHAWCQSTIPRSYGTAHSCWRASFLAFRLGGWPAMYAI